MMAEPENRKTIVLTGASRGIGHATVKRFSREGWRVITCSRQAFAENCPWPAGPEDHIKVDLSDPEDVGGAVAEIRHRLEENGGHLHALVNNAAIFEPLGWDQTTLEEWDRHLRVNLTAPFLLSQAFARSLGDGEHGRIVNLLDWRALRPGPDHLPYTISKAALAGLTRSLAAALAPRVTVNGLALGASLPPSSGSAPANLMDTIPAGRWADLEEVAQAMLFLLEGPDYITGEILHVDGGRHLV